MLVSWALPKGEPTDPAKNHLAVQTEDHPLEYGSFEGTIPAGEYGGGEVTIWDAGTYELEKWVDGKEVIVTLRSERRGARRLALIQTGGRGSGGGDENSWLIHRTKDQPGDAPDAAPTGRAATPSGRAGRRPSAASRTAPAALPDRPMLATAATHRELRGLDDGDWAFEMKWDGFRALATVLAPDGGAPEVRLTSRTGLDMTKTYPELQALAEMLDPEDLPAVLDGEIVALDPGGRPEFRRLQQRANLQKRGDVEAARRRVRVDLMLFDVLALAGEPVTDQTYDERRHLLEKAVRPRRPVHVPPAFDGDLEAATDTSRDLRLEGVIAKRRASTYAAGRRSREWLKLKHSRMQEVVVVGWRPLHAGEAREDDRTMGSLLLALPAPTDEDGAALRYVGKVGTGFREKERREIATRLRATERKTPPLDGVPRAEARHARWVTPRLVGEVEYGEWTADPTDPDLVQEARLRHPAWRGWRDDKEPADVVVE